MTDNEILILRPLYQMTERRTLEVRLDIKEQLRRGHVITIPFGWDVVTKPADTKVEVEEKPEETSTPWEFVDNNNYSPFDSQGKERMIFCTECGISIEHYDPMYQYCPYCGKRHYFDKANEWEKWNKAREAYQPPKVADEDEEIWCTECPYFKDIVDDDRDWFGALCTKDGHESSPSMYAIQSLHNDCPLKKKGGSNDTDTANPVIF